ncbi:hypothetical protein [Hydrogenophaga sp.]|jgi:hypothetical protein|uniref:hypothetical protein n=1 Tax=Hydrogenophaga sp. TaxID=1904254 RepID=UPI003F700602
MNCVKTIVCIAAVMGASANTALAQHTFSMSSEVERVENPLLTNISPGGVTVLRFAPTYAFESRGERYRSRLSLSAVIERTSDTTLLANRDFPSAGYTWGYAWPSSDLELRANLSESATRNTQFADFGRVTVDAREREFLTGARWNKEMTERTRLTLNATNRRVDYDTPLLEDYRELLLSSRVTWDHSETEAYYFEPSHSRLTPLNGGAVSTQTRWLVGTTRALSQEWSLDAFGGQSRVKGAQTETGTLGGVRLNYTGSRLTSGLEWSRDVAPIGAVSRYVRNELLGVRVGYRLTEGTSVAGRYSQSRSTDVATGRGSLFALSLDNQLAARWTSSVGVEERRSSGFGGLSGRGWAVRAGLVYSYASGL